ncbi:SRPBCC family protein [Streptomyces rimosus]|uniref:SRPBCC family protein n=1 Tax=Streptomyces rimosus TaxID=1927 RepID=UPI00378915FB
MGEFVNTVNIDIERGARTIYDYVATPKNWKGTHPVTCDVGGDVSAPAAAGAAWQEFVRSKAYDKTLNWRCTKAVPAKQWTIESADPFEPYPCEITYTFEVLGPERTTFTRTLRVPFAGEENPISAEHIEQVERDSPEYLKKVKNLMEQGR